jgi:hypothetical protein
MADDLSNQESRAGLAISRGSSGLPSKRLGSRVRGPSVKLAGCAPTDHSGCAPTDHDTRWPTEGAARED